MQNFSCTKFDVSAVSTYLRVIAFSETMDYKASTFVYPRWNKQYLKDNSKIHRYMNIVNQINFPSYSQLNPRIAYQMYDAYVR